MGGSTSLGATVDIGTTNITIHLIDLNTGNTIDTASVYNPQNKFGLDVITRARYYSRSNKSALELQNMVIAKIDSLIMQLILKSGFSTKSLEKLVCVSNTIMHHILFGLSVESLLYPPYLAVNKNEIITTSSELGLRLIPNVLVYSPPLVESFIGSDAIADIVNVLDNYADYPLLMLDVGTNTELVLVTEQRIWATSAPSGPAFEGMSLQCGMPALPGAIEQVTITNHLEKAFVHVIGNKAPAGICGTGALSTIAELKRLNLMNEMGSLDRDSQSGWLQQENAVVKYIIVPENDSATHSPIFISQIDIRMLQQSKAAIAASIMMLIQSAGLMLDEIVRVVFTGAFGTRLNPQDAIDIGLIPNFSKSEISQIKNGASKGASIILKNHEKRSMIADIIERINYVNLMNNPKFDALMAELQRFRPIQ